MSEQVPGLDPDSVAPHRRRLQLRAIRDRLRESLLFLPAVFLVVSVALVLTLAEVDERWSTHRLPLTVELTPDAAVALLGTVAGATITTAGVVFSLLVVSLQLASGQFSPRVLRGFWRDRFGQVLVGLLLATFAYCVLGLSTVNTDAEFAPPLTVQLAVGLALASIVAIVAYLNRITRHQYVGRILERVAGETLRLIAELPYGSHVGVRAGDPVDPPDVGALGEPLVVVAPASGWIQQISRRAALAAVPHGSVVRLETRVGAFIVQGGPFASVWPAPGNPQAVANLLGGVTIIGSARTMQQDIDFGLRQLNDIALRALSLAVNDPTTATEVILRLASIMRPLVLADLPAQAVRDADGRTLLTPWDLDHQEYVGHAYDQLRIYAAPHPQVAAALVRSLRMLVEACQAVGRDSLVTALEREIELTLAGCAATSMHPADLARVEAAATTPQSFRASAGAAGH